MARRPPVERKLVSVKTLLLIRVVKQEPLARSETAVVKTDDLTAFLFVAADEVVDIVVVAFELSHNFIILVKQEGEALHLPLFRCVSCGRAWPQVMFTDHLFDKLVRVAVVAPTRVYFNPIEALLAVALLVRIDLFVKVFFLQLEAEDVAPHPPSDVLCLCLQDVLCPGLPILVLRSHVSANRSSVQKA